MELRDLIELANRRNEKHYAFLRQLLVLASGALAGLVAFRGTDHSAGIALWFLRTAWVTLGFGILTGAIALHAEVAAAAALANLAAETLRKPRSPGADPDAPIAAKPSRYYRWSARVCYASLLLAVVALVAYALARD